MSMPTCGREGACVWPSSHDAVLEPHKIIQTGVETKADSCFNRSTSLSYKVPATCYFSTVQHLLHLFVLHTGSLRLCYHGRFNHYQITDNVPITESTTISMHVTDHLTMCANVLHVLTYR